MPFSAKRFPGEPIVLFTYSGLLDLPLFNEALDLNARFIAEVSGPIYVIVDMRKIETTFADMLGMVQEMQQQRPGRASDPNVKQFFIVGDHPLIRMFQDNLTRRSLPMRLAMFPTVEAALEAARIQCHIESAAS